MAGRFAPRPTRTTVRGGDTPGTTGPVLTPGLVPGTTTDPVLVPGITTDPGLLPGTTTDLGLTLGPLRRGPADPTFRVAPDGSVWRASRTPDGPGTLRIGAGKAEAWGPGGDWLLERLPTLLGAEDDPTAFVPRHKLLLATHRRRPGLRLTRTGLVLESLIPSILEQKVTTHEAYGSWRALVRKFGEPAPGPAPEGMYVMPEARTWTRIPSWEWHRANVDGKRSATIVRAARVAARLEEAALMDPPTARKRLELVPGIGPWTSAETVQRSNGAPDEVTTGDLHLPGIVGWALAGDRTADDEAMLELLAPYAGQRHRAARLILLSGRVPPRRAPRRTPGDIRAL
ncbi:3-methyladenine DNA glycosylase/8-oxoguanine DNA glycosylase [Streptomyces sp. PanSC19]|uniref:DNA-3-methyladenine glycosylase family protein n=1 Tax=Streptomyces sp. PanSC19 TaxID=1520455 RepID=UPI000F4A5A62|nr:DNA-3-methyladenine glycosylase [Streptomyces sp. PanSC19]ROQ24738.1 3-methyladenine DNA glycosylase/8-oxoguanine DNA glycosylase [Streptomyces sp. PanSC19]